MAYLNYTGFETGDLLEAFSVSGLSAADVVTVNERSGDWCLRCSPAGARESYHLGRISTSGTHLVIGRTAQTWYKFDLRLDAMPSGGTYKVASVLQADELFSVDITLSPAGLLKITSTTASAASPVTIAVGRYYRIEFRVTTGGTCALRVDGGAEVTCTGNARTQDLLVLGSRQQATYVALYDDVVISDSGYPGLSEVVRLDPNSTGASSAWTVTGAASAWEATDDWVTAGGLVDDATRITSTSDGLATTVGVVNTTGLVTAPVLSAKAVLAARGQPASAVSVRIRSGVTNSDTVETAPIDSSTAWGALAHLRDTNPSGGVAWTAAALDSVQIGVVQATVGGFYVNVVTAMALMVLHTGSPPPATLNVSAPRIGHTTAVRQAWPQVGLTALSVAAPVIVQQAVVLPAVAQLGGVAGPVQAGVPMIVRPFLVFQVGLSGIAAGGAGVSYTGQIDYDDSDTFGTNESITDRIREIRVRRGRARFNDVFTTGTMTLELDNRDGFFNLLGPNNRLKRGRRIRVSVVENGIDYPLFSGFIGNRKQLRSPGRAGRVVVECYDAFELLRKARPKFALASNNYTEQLVFTTLIRCSFPAGLIAPTRPGRVLEHYTPGDQDALATLQEVAHNEARGHVFINGAGLLVFQSRADRLEQAVANTYSGGRAIDVEGRLEDVAKEVRYQWAGLLVDSDYSDVWLMTPPGHELFPAKPAEQTRAKGYRLDPGSYPGSPRNRIIALVGSGEVAAIGAGNGPPTLNWSITVNTLEQPTTETPGTDAFNRVTVTAQNYGKQVELYFAVTGTGPVYITSLALHGWAVRRVNGDRTIAINTGVTSPIIDTVAEAQFDWLNDPNAVKTIAESDAARYAAEYPRVDFEPAMDTVANRAKVFARDLGQKVTVADTVDVDNNPATDVNGQFFIESIDFVAVRGSIPAVTWGLMQSDFSGAQLFMMAGDDEDGPALIVDDTEGYSVPYLNEPGAEETGGYYRIGV